MINGLTGMQHAAGEMGRRLTAAGYAVHLAIPEPTPTDLHHTLAGVHRLDPIRLMPAGRLARLPRFLGRIYGKLLFRRRRRVALSNLGQETYAALLQEVSPDLVLLDVEMHACVFTTHRRGIPYALISQWFQSADLPELPPIDTPLLPGQAEAIARARATAATNYAARRRTMASRQANNDRFSVLDAYRERCGFPAEWLETTGWPPPYNFRGVPTLHFCLRDLDFPHDVPSTARYVGPMVRETDGAQALTEAVATLVTSARRSGRRVIYAVGSSMRGQMSDYLPGLIQAVSGRPDWELLVSLSGKAEPADLPRPANVHYFTWLPQRELLPEVDLCIHHAGINTIHECLYCGTPMLIYSGGRHDQPGCAARMQYHGLAVVGDPRAAAGQMQADIQRALGDGELETAREAVRRRLHAPASRVALLRAVEELLER